MKKYNAIGNLAKGSTHDAAVLASTGDPPAELEDEFEKKAAIPGPSNSTTAQLTIMTMFLVSMQLIDNNC